MKALLIVPMPCDALLFFKLTNAVARRWEADNRGKKMTMAHFEQVRSDEHGSVVVVWDAPVAVDDQDTSSTET